MGSSSHLQCRQGNSQKHAWPKGLLLVLALSFPVAHAANQATLTLNDAFDAPLTTQAGDGFLDTIVGEAFRRAGLHLKLVRLPAERGLINANAGIEDGDLSRIAGLENIYPNLLRVPEKTLDMHFVAFARAAKPVQASWEAFETLAVGHIKGWKIFEQNLLPATHVTTTDTAEQLFSILEKNRIDVALYDRWQGYALAKRMQISGIHVVEPPLAEREMFIYLHRRHAAKIPAIAAALRAIKAEGMYTRICREKFSPLAIPTSQCETR